MDLFSLVKAGLNEITLSMHGTTKEVYEYLMPGARYDLLLVLIQKLADLKSIYPSFVIRVNYTVNSFNIKDLTRDKFWRLWNDVKPDVLQIRPVQKIGDSEWNDFDMESIMEAYDATIGTIIKDCLNNKIICIAPTQKQLDEVATSQDSTSAIIEDITYCYVSPSMCYKSDFDVEKDNFYSYNKKVHSIRRLFKFAFSNKKSRERNLSKKLNYTIV